MRSMTPMFRLLTALLLCVVVACGGDEEPSIDDNQNRSQQNDPDQNDPDQNDPVQNDPDDNDNGDERDFCGGTFDGPASLQVAPPEEAEEMMAPTIRRVDEKLWVTFVAGFSEGEGDDEETFNELYLVRLDCSGEPVADPMRIDDGEGMVASTGAMDTDDQTVFIVWAREHEEGTRVRAQSFDAEGTPNNDSPFPVEIDADSEVLSDLTTPDVAVNYAGDAAIIAAHPIGFSESFAVMQRFDADGQPVGEGFYLDDDTDNPQMMPAVARRDDDALVFAYIEETSMGVGDVMLGTVDADATAPDEGPTGAEPAVGGEGNDTESVRLSKNNAAGNTWASYPVGSQGENSVTVRSGWVIGPRDGESSRVSGRTSLRPAVAGSETGGAIAWLSSGGDGTGVHLQRFVGGGTTVSSTGSVLDQHPEGDAAGFGPDITWIGDDVFAAVWVDDGDEELESTVEGRIIDFEAEE